MSRIVGVSGYGHSGKDTIGQILVEQHDFVRASFADALREFCLAVDPVIFCAPDGSPVRLSYLLEQHGYETAKLVPEVRRFYQRVGTEGGRKVLGEDIWVDTAMSRLVRGFDYVFTDVRFHNEAMAVRSAGGSVWRVHRPGFGPVNDHISETGLDDFDFDFVIENDSTLTDLAAEVQGLVSQVHSCS